MIIFVASGDGRFEGSNLLTHSAKVTHRGTNDVILNVTDQITGTILSTGNLILKNNKPQVIDVSEENIGKLIINTD